MNLAPGVLVTAGGYLFDSGTIDCFVGGCREAACMRCAVCEKHVSITHFWMFQMLKLLETSLVVQYKSFPSAQISK